VTDMEQIKYIRIFIWLLEWGWGPPFVATITYLTQIYKLSGQRRGDGMKQLRTDCQPAENRTGDILNKNMG
jgi:hypothetical protein